MKNDLTPPVEKPARVSLADRLSQQIDAAGLTIDRPAPTADVPVTPKVEAKPAETEVSEVALVTADVFTSLEDEPAKPVKPAKEVAEKPEEGATDETETAEEVPEFVKKQGDKAVETWGILKKQAAQAKTLSKQVEELTKKVEEAGKTSPDLEELRKQIAEKDAALAEREKIIAATSVEQSSEYKKAIVEPLALLDQEITELSETPEVAKAVTDAMLITDRRKRAAELSSAVEDLPDYARHRVYEMVKEMDAIFAHEETLRERALEAKSEIDRNELAKKGQESEQDKQARIAAADKVWGNVRKELPFIFDEKGEVLEEFKDVREIGARESIVEASLGAQVFAGFAIQLVPKLKTVIQGKEKEIKELRSQVDRLTGAHPGKKVTPVTPSKEDKPAKRQGFLERIESQIAAGKVEGVR